MFIHIDVCINHCNGEATILVGKLRWSLSVLGSLTCMPWRNVLYKLGFEFGVTYMIWADMSSVFCSQSSGVSNLCPLFQFAL